MDTTVRRPVRMPFRVLAALICVTVAVTAGAMLFMAWRDVYIVKVGDILMLPLEAWVVRMLYHAAARGTTPEDGPYWPLASRRVWNCYVVLLLAYSILKP